MRAPTTTRPSLTELLVVAGLCLLGTCLRVAGLDYGLPAIYNPDEVAIMSRALGFASGDLNPHNFLYPTFYFYVLFAWLGGFFALARATGAVASLGAFQTEFFTDPSRIYLAGRTLSVLCGVACIVATWWLARRMFSKSAALAAAALLTVSPIAVRDAHYVKHDVPATLAILVAFIGIVCLMARSRASSRPGADDRTGWSGRTGDAAIAGALCGVAFSTHYYAIFLVLPLALAIDFGRPAMAALERWKKADAPDASTGNGEPDLRTVAIGRPGTVAAARDAVVALAAFAAAFFALSPFILVEPRTALADIIANRQIVVDRASASGNALISGGRAYAAMLWRDGLGPPGFLLSIAGLVLVARRSIAAAIILASFPLAFFLFISNTVPASRYLNPVLPFTALFAGVAVAGLARAVASLMRQGARGSAMARDEWRMPAGWVAAALTAAVAVPGVRGSILTGRFFAQDDTRTIARRFIESQIPDGASILIQPYSVPIAQSRESLVEALTARLGDPARASRKFALRLALLRWPEPSYRTIYLGDGGLDADKIYVSYRDVSGPDAIQRLTALPVEYVVLKDGNVEDPNAAPLRRALERQATLLTRISPYRDETDPGRTTVAPFLHNTDTPIDRLLTRPGPIVEVWALRPVLGVAFRDIFGADGGNSVLER